MVAYNSSLTETPVLADSGGCLLGAGRGSEGMRVGADCLHTLPRPTALAQLTKPGDSTCLRLANQIPSPESLEQGPRSAGGVWALCGSRAPPFGLQGHLSWSLTSPHPLNTVLKLAGGLDVWELLARGRTRELKI